MLKKLMSKDGFASAMSSVTAIVVGLLVGVVIIVVSNPSQALNGISSMLFGALSDLKNTGQIFYFATPIILTGLSVGFANKTGLFNIGGPGQFIVGAYVAVLIGVKLTLPAPLAWSHWIIAIICAAIAGAIWGSVPGILKAYYNVNEVITCIMMNYIGMYFVNYLVKLTVFDNLRNQSLMVKSSAVVPKLGLDKIFSSGLSSSSINAGIFIAILMGIVVNIVLTKTKFGFELKACGYNRDASKYAGINENKSIVLSMVIAGALCGIGGALLYLAGSGKGIEVVDVLAVEGFNGIPVSLLGLNNPIGIIFAGIFIAYLTVGGSTMQLYGFVPQVIEIITSVIIYFSAFSLLIKGYIKARGKNSDEENANADKTVKQLNSEVITENPTDDEVIETEESFSDDTTEEGGNN